MPSPSSRHCARSGRLVAGLVPAALAAQAQGTFTSTSTFACAGTGEFAGAEDFCEACNSDGLWDVSVSPTPSSGASLGLEPLVTTTDYCPDEIRDLSARVGVAAVPGHATGAALSASF